MAVSDLDDDKLRRRLRCLGWIEPELGAPQASSVAATFKSGRGESSESLVKANARKRAVT